MLTDSVPRRTLLEVAVRIAATPVGVAFFSSWSRAAQEHHEAHSSGAPSEPLTFQNYSPQFFSAEDFEVLNAFTEILIPTDETPGAREAHCAHFIDFLLHAMDGHSPEIQNQWRSALSSLRAAGFHSAAPEARLALVSEMAKPEKDHTAQHPAFSAYRLIKRENTFAFYTARSGLIDTLDYRGNSYNIEFPSCTHPEHHEV